ncbi:uncharacterized protein LY89DRAFT_204398 [Mollisia scopiformis]|uniref:Uncharacterized protein n=1 Tax=Mollisia scopiformis TaxID=149040 RepID=A0A194WWC3_MOLSC|nr:uncharacterized protein LY89DRAFT_204398 [Mollisia scopiformis]KUJ12276.1 hypothetical protein LY89DRAFT_204398 [Mollisia scopiformis]
MKVNLPQGGCGLDWTVGNSRRLPPSGSLHDPAHLKCKHTREAADAGRCFSCCLFLKRDRTLITWFASHDSVPLCPCEDWAWTRQDRVESAVDMGLRWLFSSWVSEEEDKCKETSVRPLAYQRFGVSSCQEHWKGETLRCTLFFIASAMVPYAVVDSVIAPSHASSLLSYSFSAAGVVCQTAVVVVVVVVVRLFRHGARIMLKLLLLVLLKFLLASCSLPPRSHFTRLGRTWRDKLLPSTVTPRSPLVDHFQGTNERYFRTEYCMESDTPYEYVIAAENYQYDPAPPLLPYAYLVFPPEPEEAPAHRTPPSGWNNADRLRDSIAKMEMHPSTPD